MLDRRITFSRCAPSDFVGQKAGHVDLDARREFGAVKAIASLQLKAFFIVLTLFAVWLGWNVSVVRPSRLREMIEGRPGGGGIMPLLPTRKATPQRWQSVNVSPRTFSRH